MTALQEAPDIADIIAGALQVSRGTAYDLMRTALAQQEADKPFQPDWVNYRQGVEDGKAEALLAQQGERKNCPQPEICGSKECEFCRDTAAPAPQAQDKSDNYLSGYCTGRTDLLKEQSAQPVSQPLSDSEIEKLREKTFSTYNPYCPVDSKSMRKAVRAAEAAHGIGEVK